MTLQSSPPSVRQPTACSKETSFLAVRLFRKVGKQCCAFLPPLGGVHPCPPQQRLGAALLRGHRLEQGRHLGGREAAVAGRDGWRHAHTHRSVGGRQPARVHTHTLRYIHTPSGTYTHPQVHTYTLRYTHTLSGTCRAPTRQPGIPTGGPKGT